MPKSSSSTRRESKQLEKQDMQYEALKEQVLSQAPTSNYKNTKSEDEKLDMAVQYRKYMNGGFLDFHEVDEFHKGRMLQELNVSWRALSTMCGCSVQKLRTRSERGVGTQRSKGGRPRAAKKDDLEDAEAIIQGQILTDEVLSTPQIRNLLRDIFSGLGTTRLQEITSGADVPQSGTLSKDTINKYLRIICPETLGVASLHDRRRKETMLDPYAMLSLIAGVEGAMLPVPDSIYPHTLRRVHPWNLINTDVSSLELQKKEKGTSKVYAPEGAKNKF